jgi:glycerophosphoryl diester phosphodiesterase
VFRGPTLLQAWDGAAGAGSIKLDLMQTDRGFLDDLVAFLASRAGSRRVVISSRDPGALLYLHRRLPDVAMLFSVAGPMLSTSSSRTQRCKGPSAAYRPFRAWWMRTWSPGCTRIGW